MYWFALSVKSRHEKSVSRFLADLGYESFLPIYKKQHCYGRRLREFELPLFAGYVFCRFSPFRRLPVLLTPGVIGIVGVGRTPMPLDDCEMMALQTAVQARLPLTPFPFPEAGQKVLVGKGPLSGVVGTVVRMNQSLRIVLSVEMLKRSVLVEVDSDCVQRSIEREVNPYAAPRPVERF